MPKRRRVGRPKGREFETQFNMRINAHCLAILDNWRERQPDVPGRSEAIRRMIELAGKQKGAA